MKKIPKETTGDIIHKIFKGGVSIFGTGLAAEFFELAIKPPYTKRLKEWMESVAEDFEKLKEQVEGFKIEDLANNEMFTTTMLHATQVAIRNHQKEKLEALRAAVLNSTSSSAPEENLQLMFLNFVDELIPMHLSILKFFDSPERWINKFNIEIPDWEEASPSQVFFQVFPEMDKQRPFFNLLLQDLDLKELLSEGKLQSSMKKMVYLRISHTTSFGKQFLQFITSPFEEVKNNTT